VHLRSKEHGFTHRPVNVHAGIRVRAKVYHVQNVNAYTSRLKEWMHRFHGMATKHLHSYLGWRRMLERSGNDLNPKALLDSVRRVLECSTENSDIALEKGGNGALACQPVNGS